MSRVQYHAALALVALLAGVSASHTGAGYVCQHPPYETRLISSSPLVVYLDGFVTPEERFHLKAATHGLFARSAVAGRDSADDRTINRVRTSQSTNIPRDDVVQCIEQRALRFQGLFAEQEERLEPLQLVKYGIGEHYHYHTDWYTDPVHATADLGGNRASSFFAYVHVSGNESTSTEKLRGGGTNFPVLDAPIEDGWCDFIDCDEPWENGITFRPVEGSAVYWENLVPGSQDQGDPRTLHAGLAVVRGEKIGMNIWTRQSKLPLGAR
ncbi:prolyl 4-hydroxylase alpha [Ophiostoma piceae UAMH 11346]|uniref:Prolyl 4-hydroxylase alpha n=1 Tax=Ophiostoma piceae (strain UAMH 11346) TaxID=1262450 RepID=S3CN81_OPHP1|nr:prolyl 4-hydroxylase alpha [Ophiostoma piceae UAMH 11346]